MGEVRGEDVGGNTGQAVVELGIDCVSLIRTVTMQLRLELQQSPVADEVAAITAVVRPILTGILYALKTDIAEQAGGYQNLTLEMLLRLHNPGDGDCGICFEYAVHDAMNREDGVVVDRVSEAVSKHCRVKGKDPASILFGAEKTGTVQLIDTAKDILTDESTLQYGKRGRPVKLLRHIDGIATAFRRPADRQFLPQSIGDLWKADLFLGFTDSDNWVGTSVKINPSHLEAARGLRVGIVPSREGTADKIVVDTKRNLVVCPLPHDGSFMETFYKGWNVVQQLLASKGKMPKEVAIPRPPERQVARYLVDRMRFPVLDVVEALGPLAQPELMKTETRQADVELRRQGASEATSLITPFPSVTE